MVSVDKTAAAEILLHPNREWVYVSSRGVGLVAVFRLDPTHDELTKVQEFNIQGTWPRSMALSPTGDVLAVADQFSDSVQLLAVSPVYVLQLCYGMTSSFPAVTTPQLTANCSARLSFSLTRDQESWIVAMDSVISPLTSILSGQLQTSLGPRSVLLLTCLPYSLSWVSAGLSGLYNDLSLLYLSR